ncbi:MAG: hypothetical protein CVU42_00930 [Chloroflexi bacterium HGW-Chloroflexi-4]|jgi:hypothetical protein|nr:MAG: hypothetical protein CVU42_00930 [Chloroflexi bacterium HGW-Chloroflexi-4]
MTKTKMSKFLKILAGNLLIFLIPVMVPLFTYVKNYIETPLGVFFRAAIISIFLFNILLLVSFVIFQNASKTIFFSCIAFLLLSTYGVTYDLFAQNGHVLGHHKILALIYFVFVSGFIFLISKIRSFGTLNLAIKILCCVFIFFQIIRLLPLVFNEETGYNVNDYISYADQYQVATQKPDFIENETLPDVYYIILDSYARNDMIDQDFAFDNSYFTDNLEDLGFYVAECSRSNYMITRSSLSSSLNMSYLSDFIANAPKTLDKDVILATLIKNSTVFRQFDELGYETVAFESGYDFTEIKNFDVYLQTKKPVAFLGSIDPYEILLLKSSIFKIIYDTHIPFINNIFDKITFPHTNHVKLQLYMFDQLKQISIDPDPTFTFAHLTVPHTPFVFRADGSYTKDRRYFSGQHVTPVSNELFNEGYINQVQFVNNAILSTINEILGNSKTTPIIIIQGDHGAIIEHRFPILNAYLIPDVYNSNLYSSISPVNSFRLIFKDIYGLDLTLLEDNSYYANYETSYDWTMVSEEMPGCIK